MISLVGSSSSNNSSQASAPSSPSYKKDTQSSQEENVNDIAHAILELKSPFLLEASPSNINQKDAENLIDLGQCKVFQTDASDLTDGQIAYIADYFKESQNAPTSEEVQNAFLEIHVNVSKTDIRNHRHRWNIPTDKREYIRNAPTKQEVATINALYEGKEPPTADQLVDDFLRLTGKEYTKKKFSQMRHRWGIYSPPKKVVSPRLSKEQQATLSAFFQGKTPSNIEVREKIQELFDLDISKSAINGNRVKWGIATPLKKKSARQLNDTEIAQMKAFFDGTGIPEATEIQNYILENFKTLHTLSSIRKLRRRWGIDSKPLEVHATPLIKDQIEELKSHFVRRKKIHAKEIKKKIFHLFGLEYSESTIYGNHHKWGLPIYK